MFGILETVAVLCALVISWLVMYLLGIRTANKRRWKLTQKMDSVSPMDIYGYDPKNPMNCGRAQETVTIEGKTFYKVHPMGGEVYDSRKNH